MDNAIKTFHKNHSGGYKKNAKREAAALRRRIGKAEAKNNGEATHRNNGR